MGLEKTKTIHRIIIHPQNPDIIFVAATGSAWGDHPERGVYKTSDGGESWEKILYVNERTGCADLVMDPSNPNKLIAAMWEYRRWPWFFKSGGEGSGMFITLDGGKSWTQKTAKDGLPKGELGRMGLAIARSNPKVIYALIESKNNALYGSKDGGHSWKMINDKEEIGNRPFYYADIFVDPQNENRIYSLYSMISRSEDGGKSFEIIVPYSGVHPDHHAFWIHPEDPAFIIDGNDGGMAISKDMGKNWRFVENLPLAQFYHISIDNEFPYHVYGGMQDNGSWRGPAYVLRYGGIRNSYWEEVFFGDGFDVLPDPAYPNRYGYAMSQGGSLGRYDLRTGYSKLIKPVHPEGIPLRFNWNAAIAQDPFDDATIYYGSQFVHKSTDRGDNWEVISPDLTSNDPEKQKQLESGGLTYDVTQAENYTTIVAIAPSPVSKEILWVGTDDGELQLTKDGGENWISLSSRLRGLPKGSWIPQIHPSTYNEGEAFVVANNYRRDDWTTYVYHTKDYGLSWRRIASDLWGYAHCIVQDPLVPNLLFLGTEFGLYVSIDSGNNWVKWTHGFPTVATVDLKIHPSEHDLVIGTFGRAAFVIDDIGPLRAFAKEGKDILDKGIRIFTPPVGKQAEYKEATGTRFAADAIYAGENRRRGAMISYYVKEGNSEEEKKKEKAFFDIYDQEGQVIRSLSQAPDSGLNRIYWQMNRKGIRFPGSRPPQKDAPEPGGMPVEPGTYKIKLRYKGLVDSTDITVVSDPRINISPASRRSLNELRAQYDEQIKGLTTAMDRIREAEKTIGLINQQIPKEDTSYQELQQLSGAMKDSLIVLKEKFSGKEDVQGILRDPSTVRSQIFSARRYLYGTLEAPSSTHRYIISQAEKAIDSWLEAFNSFFSNDWTKFQQSVEAANLSPFKGPYTPIKR